MGIYIWLLFQNAVLYCVAGSGCTQSSNNTLDYLIGIGAVEVAFEIATVIKIFTRRNLPKDTPKDLIITKKSHRKQK